MFQMNTTNKFYITKPKKKKRFAILTTSYSINKATNPTLAKIVVAAFPALTENGGTSKVWASVQKWCYVISK